MKTDHIKAIKIDENGRLLIYPEFEKFTFIYRAAAEVNWDKNLHFLYSPKPREWSYYDWFGQIVSVVESEYNCKLRITAKTLWIDIPDSLKQQIILT